MKHWAAKWKIIARALSILALSAGSAVLPSGTAHAACGGISLTTIGSPYTQNFDTLSNVAGSTTNNLTIPGWFMTESGGGARDNEQYAVDTGASVTGDTYSYGSAGSTERALGQLRSGTLIPLFGGCFTNNTGATITSLSIAYNGEEWRLGTAGRTDQVNFEYSTNASDLVTGTWTNVAALNFVTPDTATVGAKNGNAAADRTALSSTLTGLSIPNGADFWIRWNDTDASGADDGLAIDDLSLTPQSVVTPNLTINDVSLNEGNAGTTSFTFTASLSAPAGPGGVTFDIATADGTAAAPGDYTSKSLTAQTIPAGNSTYSFTVLVNGDTTPEANETFFVNITNVTGATVTDGQGQGTIVNDDAAPNLTLNDVALNEGNSGITTFTFTASLSAPAPAGGVTFDIATADGTATAPGDYTTKSLTGQTIPAGSSTYTFDVSVNGDSTPEPDETFFVSVTNVTNAIVTDGQGVGTIANDDLTKIHDVQGNGAATPIPGATVVVEGVVVANFQGTNKLQGFFLQEEDADADADPATSEGIFIFCGTCPTAVAEGQRVRATGVVSEFNNMTEITASSAGSVVVTSAGNHLAEVTPAPIDLPIVGNLDDFYEAREGMLVNFVDQLTVGDYSDLARFGQIELYEGGRPYQYTETSAPSVAGYTAYQDNLARRRVVLDDDNNTQNAYLSLANGSQYLFYPQANGGFSVGTQGTDFFRGGDLVSGLTGVLHWSFPGTGADTWRIRPAAVHPATFTVANPRPATPPAVGGAIKAAGMNLLNYFTTIDTTASSSTGPCGPTGTLDCRGADSVAELNRQRERASIVICSLGADVYAFMELENTTPSDTITDLLGAVNARCGGVHPYTFVNTGGTLGTDAIRVAMIYRTGILSPVGSPLVDLDPVHSRPPTAQTFDVVDATNPAFGQRFTVIANHLKSKGCPGTGADADAGDGQGCFNATRTAQANRLLTWVAGTVIPAAGDPDVLLLGDFNSYAREDPITTLTGGGYTDLATTLLPPGSYSYLFDGQLGHLDYAFANTSLAPQVTGIGQWHINADEVPVFDYNDEVLDSPGEASFEEKPDGSALTPPRVVFQPASPYRASDHDPVIVGLFPLADLSVAIVDAPDPVPAGNTLSYTITVANAGPASAAAVSLSDTLPAGTTFGSLTSAAGWSCTTPAVGAGGTVACTTASMAVGSAVFTLNVQVGANTANGTVLSNTATVSSSTGDPSSGDLSATATTTVIDTLAPTVTIDQAAGQADPAVSSPVDFTATFSEPVNGFDAADITITGTAGATTATVTGSGPTYNVAISGMTSAGTIVVTIPAGAAQDLAGNPSAASTSTDNTVSFDPVLPIATGIARAGATPTNAATLQFNVTFLKDVTGVDVTDFSLATSGVTGASIVSVTGSGTTRTVTVNTGSGDGSIGLNLVDDDTIVDLNGTPLGGKGAGNGDLAGQVYIIDKTAPEAGGLAALDITTSGGATYSFTLVLSDNLAVDINSLDGSDIHVTGPGGFDQLAGLVSVAPATSGTPRTATYSIAAPGGAWDSADNGTYTVTLVASQVRDTAGNTAGQAVLGTFSVAVSAAAHAIYLPNIQREGAPDLVITGITLVPSKSTFAAGEPVELLVTVQNQGKATAKGFWVDLYINPSSPPIAANQPWNTRCALAPCFGMAWEITGELAPGQTIVLSSRSLPAGYSVWPGYFASGTSDLYAYADSYSAGVVSGAVAESDEANNQFHLGGLVVTGLNPAQASAQGFGSLRPRAAHRVR